MNKVISHAEAAARVGRMLLTIAAMQSDSSAPSIAEIEKICTAQAHASENELADGEQAWQGANSTPLIAPPSGTHIGTQADAVSEEYGPSLIGDEEKETVNQSHFAARYVKDSGIIHDPSIRRFFVYESTTGLWRHQTDDATVANLAKTYQKIVVESDRPKLLAKRTASLLAGLRELARGIAEKRDVFGAHKDVVHVANGMLKLTTSGGVELLPFAPEYFSRNRSEYAWISMAECPRFLNELLVGAMPPEDVELIQKYFGQCLLGVNPSQTFLVLRGTPGGGKSTLANIIEGIIGRHNVSELRLSLLTERFEVARYIGRTLLSAKDAPGDFLNMRPAHVLKALVGGDTLEGEIKHGNESFSVKGSFNVIISTNTRLRVKLDSDAGAWRRRLLIVDYSRPKPDKAIRNFDDVLLRSEGPGILRWALAGAILLLKDLDEVGHIRLTEGQSRRIDDLLSESDSVRAFVREMIEPRHGAELTVAAIVAKYRDYCENHDWEPLRDKQFQAELPDAMLDYYRAARRNDIKSEGTSVRGFRGVAFRDTRIDPPQPPQQTETGSTDLFSDVSDGLQNNTHIGKGSNCTQDKMPIEYAICSKTSSDPSEANPFE